MHTFFEWYDTVLKDAPQTVIGKLMTAAGFHVAHTGGGCLAWEWCLDNGYYFWITDEGGVDLGDEATESWFVGVYDVEGYAKCGPTFETAQEAIDWCKQHERTPKLSREAPDWNGTICGSGSCAPKYLSDARKPKRKTSGVRL